MIITVTNIETNQYLRTITESEFFQMCGNDEKMKNDYIYRLKNNPKVKYLDEIWTIEDE